MDYWDLNPSAIVDVSQQLHNTVVATLGPDTGGEYIVNIGGSGRSRFEADAEVTEKGIKLSWIDRKEEEQETLVPWSVIYRQLMILNRK